MKKIRMSIALVVCMSVFVSCGGGVEENETGGEGSIENAPDESQVDESESTNEEPDEETQVVDSVSAEIDMTESELDEALNDLD